MTERPGASSSPPSRRPRRIDFPEPRRSRWPEPVSLIGVAILLPVAILVVSAFLMGWKFQPIESGSMEPRHPTGSLAVVEPIDATDVEPGMVIVFEDPQGRGRLVAHRATTRLPGDLPVWETKGDANAEADPIPVQGSAIQGRVRWTIPLVGHLVSAVRGPQAVLLLVGLPLAALVITEVRARIRRDPARHTRRALLP